jgi:hypothetical protein
VSEPVVLPQLLTMFCNPGTACLRPSQALARPTEPLPVRSLPSSELCYHCQRGPGTPPAQAGRGGAPLRRRGKMSR